MRKAYSVGVSLLVLLCGVAQLAAYPPAVGITSKSKNCLSCHVNNGPWGDEGTIIDIVDKATGQSLRQPDGSFLISAHRGETRRLMTVIGRKAGDTIETPYRNGWIFIDPARIESGSLNKFAPGWEVDLPASCRLVGDKSDLFPEASVTSLQFTVRPSDDARDGELSWQIMLTKGESVKGKAAEGMIGSYFEKKVVLRVVE
ncbi:MAG TPA: hypothetical protein VN285_00305 [Candidatus Deferrimicrobium sp.]|nr:hypothetical protein [Candidatus Deferrimicrobium sp.]